MSTLDEPRLMTVEEFLALPDDGVERWLINGELRPRVTGTTYRNANHAILVSRLSQKLLNWLDAQPKPRGIIGCGEIGFRFPGVGGNVVAADVAYVMQDVAAQRSRAGVIQGAPLLAVEVLSPSDSVEDIDEKIDAYLAAGTQSVWIVHPTRKTVVIYSAGKSPAWFNAEQILTSDSLPGFSLPLSELFAD